LDVFFTVDTEFSPASLADARKDFAPWIARDIDGATKRGSYGLDYQLGVFDRHRLKAVFLVEALHASVVGFDPLRRIVATVLERGHEVGLHVHSEWRPPGVKPKEGLSGDRLCHFSEDDQRRLIAEAKANLRRAGCDDPKVFRAGHYAADRATLRAAAAEGLVFDTSYNRSHLDAASDFPSEPPWVAPRRVDGLVEVPVACFLHLPGRHRPAQLCACSIAELMGAMTAAAARGDRAFVLVSHTFEMVVRRDRAPTEALPSPLVVRRFDALCAALAERRDLFDVIGFRDADAEKLASAKDAAPLASPLARTIARYGQQITGFGS
jgi:peptidoglycan/xylan/chitin deacetylase (PgdA/CDA1 family)